MSASSDQMIAELLDELRKQEAEAQETKRLINVLCRRCGKPPMFADADASSASDAPLSIQADQFYGQPLQSCIRTVLEMRRALKQGPASINDIYNTLTAGGFKFETKDEDNAKRGLRQSITKNATVFHKLPNNLIGLLEWYPTVKSRKRADGSQDDNGSVQADDATDESQESATESGGEK